MKKIVTTMIAILGMFAALVLAAPSSAEQVQNPPECSKYVMFTSDLWKTPDADENCGEVTVFRKKDNVYADFYFISPLKNQLYDIILLIPLHPYCDCDVVCTDCEDCTTCMCECEALCATEVEIGVAETDENGVGDVVVTFDQQEIMEAIYADIVAIWPDPGPPLEPIEQWFAGTQYLPSTSFLLEAVNPVCHCGEDCCTAQTCVEPTDPFGPPCCPEGSTELCPAPPDGVRIVNAFKLTNDGSAFFED